MIARAHLVVWIMTQVAQKTLRLRTWRVRRTIIDRLRGYNQVYQTQMSDGFREAYGKGPTRDKSQDAAKRKWERRFGEHAVGRFAWQVVGVRKARDFFFRAGRRHLPPAVSRD